MNKVLAAGTVAGVAVALGLGAVPAEAFPAAAFPVSAVSESPTAGETWAGGTSVSGPEVSKTGLSNTGLSEAGLNEAVLRDLGLTPEEFQAAGEVGKRAAEAVSALRDVPGYLGVRLKDAKIIVTGTGAELGAAAAKLTETIPGLEIQSAVLAAAAPEEPPTAPTKSAPPAAPAQGPGRPELALTTEQLFQDYLREVGTEGLQAVVMSGGKFVIRTGGTNSPESAPEAATGLVTGTAGATGTGKISPSEFVSRYANVSLDDDGARLAPEADVPGGLGYAADNGIICSTGFSAFDPAGLPAVLTAGHCSADGDAETATLQFQGVPAGLLGKFGFSQFGGPGNSTVLHPLDPTNPGNVGTDIAVIEELRADLDPLPAASTWGDPSEPGPDVKIIGTAAPVVGQPVCRSGRTSAWSCGTIDEVGIYIVRGITSAPADLRAFNGFLSFDVQSSGGDSGGPWLSGNYAVGTHTAGDTPDANGNFVKNFAIAATLDDAMSVLPGYQLELFLNKPTVTSPAPGATFDAGQTVTGVVAGAPASAVAAGSKIRITVRGRVPVEVPVDAGGAWSFTAPAVAGPLRFTAETVNGFSTSGVAAFDFTPVSQPSPPALVVIHAAAGPAEVPAANGAAPPAGDSAAVVRPLGDSRAASLANTGASGLVLSAGLAAGALAVGGVFLVLVKRRKRQRPTRS